MASTKNSRFVSLEGIQLGSSRGVKRTTSISNQEFSASRAGSHRNPSARIQQCCLTHKPQRLIAITSIISASISERSGLPFGQFSAQFNGAFCNQNSGE